MLQNIKEFFEKIRGKIVLLINKTKDFIKTSKEKFHNLYQTNYDTGMYHLEHGNLWDASLRFKIIKRFWPDQLEAQYKYAYCLVLQEFNQDAKILLTEILQKDPNYNDVKQLLEKITNSDTKKILEDYKNNLENSKKVKEIKNDEQIK